MTFIFQLNCAEGSVGQLKNERHGQKDNNEDSAMSMKSSTLYVHCL